MSFYPIPSLSDDGNIESTAIAIKKLYDYFLVADYSQTFFYTKHIASLKYLMNQYKTTDAVFKEKVTSTLENMYNRYFEFVEVLVRLETSGSVITMYIDVEVTVDEKVVSLSESVTFEESRRFFVNKYIDELNMKG